jgi:uncharacterized protein (DUF58 family)
LTQTGTLTQAQSLASGLPKLILAAERLAFIAAPGLHGRRRGGQGDSFWQFRDWQNGDDARSIDWRRSAQGDRLYLREREWEAQASVALTLEDTETLNFSSGKALPTKRDRAVLLLLALASILLRAGERVALSGITQAASGHHTLHHIAAGLLHSARTQLPTDPRARRIIFGDFLTPAPHFTAPPGGAVLQLLDPAECDFPYAGRVIFEGMGHESPLETTNAQDWQSTYRARIAAQRDAVIQAAQSTGQTALFHRTDMPPATALAALYQALRRQ